MVVNYDPNLIGKVFETTDAVEVKAERIQSFCETLGETNPLYADGKVAPPAYAVTFRNGRHFFQHVPRFGRAGFDAGKDVEFVRSIHAATRSR